MAAQTYLSMLCLFKWGIFMFFAGMVGIMTLTVLFFYPETKGLPIEEAPHVFADHWCAHIPVHTCKIARPSNSHGEHILDRTLEGRVGLEIVALFKAYHSMGQWAILAQVLEAVCAAGALVGRGKGELE